MESAATIFDVSELSTKLGSVNFNDAAPDKKLEPSRFNQLPPELITEVLEHFIAQAAHEYQEAVGTWAVFTARYPLPYSWATVEHVCRLWRDIIRSTPQLSSRIVLTSSAVVQKYLQRAGDVLLEIMSAPLANGFDNEAGTQAFESVLPFFPRVVRADIVVTTPILEMIRREGAAAPRELPLCELLLNFYGLSYHTFDPSAPIFPGVRFPVLRRFSCIGGHAGICRGFVGESLAALVLSDLDFTLCSHQLITFLSDCPNLEDLLVRNALRWGADDALDAVTSEGWTARQKVRLPRIRTVVLDDVTDMALSVYFIHHLILPSSVSISLLRRICSPTYSIRTMADAVGERFARKAGFVDRLPEVHSVTVAMYNQGPVRATLRQASEASADATPLLDIFGRQDGLDDMLNLLSSMPFSSVTYLVLAALSDNDNFATGNLVALLSAMPHLRGLQVIGTCVWQVVETVLKPQQCSYDEELTVPCRNLKTLHLMLHGRISFSSASRAEWVPRLYGSLSSRSKCGYILDELRLSIPDDDGKELFEKVIAGWPVKMAKRVVLGSWARRLI